MLVATFADFVSAVSQYMSERKAMPNRYGPPWRAGQSAFNMLVQVRPDIAELVRGSDFDPFHNDARLPEFYNFVMRHWDA